MNAPEIIVSIAKNSTKDVAMFYDNYSIASLSTTETDEALAIQQFMNKLKGAWDKFEKITPPSVNAHGYVKYPGESLTIQEISTCVDCGYTDCICNPDDDYCEECGDHFNDCECGY